MPHVPGKHTIVDCTFKGGRMQSDILKEVDIPVEEDKEPELPVSMTPEQLKVYCMQMIHSTKDQMKRRVFAELVRIIEENGEMKKKLREIKLRELRDSALNEETPDDIQE